MFTAYLCWITGAALTCAGMTTPDDPMDARRVFADYSMLPYWLKFIVLYFITITTVLLWPAFLMAAIRNLRP